MVARVGKKYKIWGGTVAFGLAAVQEILFGRSYPVRIQIGRHKPKPKIFGFYYAFKATVARSPDADQLGPPTCAGPCDEATTPSPYDVGLFFNMGINWGR